MLFRHAVFVSATLSIFLCRSEAAPAASGADLDREYEQVRKIALRDPKVQSAFESANERLNRKILELDPALESYLKNRAHPPAPASETKPSRVPFLAPGSTPARHTVAKGDTLSSIAKRYGVSVAELKRLNRIDDERMLIVGHNLIIPPKSR